MSERLDAMLAQGLYQRRQHDLYRHRVPINSTQGARILIGKRRVLNFSSNDYLGLASDTQLIHRLQKAAACYGVGSGASHLISGHHTEHHLLEEALAEYVGRERALVFSSGYMANLGVISALVGRYDIVFQDRLNHTSLLEASRLSRARMQRYRHNDSAHLAHCLQRFSAANRWVVTDAVFSMDGDIAPLDQLADLARQHQAWLMIDDAHGFGICGPNGRGSAAHFHLDQSSVPIIMATLSKALGVVGAFVAGSDTLIETLIQYAKPYIYTTALPAALAATARTSLQMVQQQSWRREKLMHLVGVFQAGARQLQLPLQDSMTPIQPIIVGSAQAALSIHQALYQQDIWVPAIRPPTVPQGSARLRVTLSAAHDEQDIAQLLDALDQAFNKPHVTYA